MDTKIIITVFGGLNVNEKRHMQYLLADALASFRATRSDATPQQYVESRYSWFTDDEKQEKINQVRARVSLARKLHNAVLHHKLVDEPHKHTPAHGANNTFVCSTCFQRVDKLEALCSED